MHQNTRDMAGRGAQNFCESAFVDDIAGVVSVSDGVVPQPRRAA